MSFFSRLVDLGRFTHLMDCTATRPSGRRPLWISSWRHGVFEALGHKLYMHCDPWHTHGSLQERNRSVTFWPPYETPLLTYIRVWMAWRKEYTNPTGAPPVQNYPYDYASRRFSPAQLLDTFQDQRELSVKARCDAMPVWLSCPIRRTIFQSALG